MDELTVPVWWLYHQPNLKYSILFVGGTELRTDGQTYQRTDGRSDYKNAPGGPVRPGACIKICMNLLKLHDNELNIFVSSMTTHQIWMRNLIIYDLWSTVNFLNVFPVLSRKLNSLISDILLLKLKFINQYDRHLLLKYFSNNNHRTFYT